MGNPRIDTARTRRRIEDALRKTADEKKLVDAAMLLGIEIAYLPELNVCPLADRSRPNFGQKQVRFLCQLQVGKRYISVFKSYRDLPFVVLEPPRRLENGKWWIKIRREFGYEELFNDLSISLADYSIVPYENGKWNQVNYISFLEGEEYGFFCHCSIGCGHCLHPNLQYS